MPALFALAQHDGLVEADSKLEAGERLFSFLDDLYLTTTKKRACDAFDTVAECVHRHAGVRTNFGKLKAWSRAGGDAPRGLGAPLRSQQNSPASRHVRELWSCIAPHLLYPAC